MRYAFELATKGNGTVSPNPMVACLIVHENRIIGEGYHERYGQNHAEPNALESVLPADRSLIKDSTIYVTLEPCSHYGKTPPCADLIAEHKPKHVIICNTDPNPKVSGRGIKKIREANIEVTTGIMQHEGELLNRRFFTRFTQNRPYIILKWAQTEDGYISRLNYDSKWISNEASRDLVHTWRAHEDAIMVGTTTAIHDNPTLNVRNGSGNDPLRVIIDKQLRIPESHNIFSNQQQTLIYNSLQTEKKGLTEWIKIDLGKSFVHELLRDLNDRNIQSIIIEGGAYTLNQFIEEGIWDETRIFTSKKRFHEGIKAPQIKGKLINTQANGDRLDFIINTNNPLFKNKKFENPSLFDYFLV